MNTPNKIHIDNQLIKYTNFIFFFRNFHPPKSPKSPRVFEFDQQPPKSPKITRTFTKQSSNVTSDFYYENNSPVYYDQSPKIKSPKSPSSHFDYPAISPKFEKKAVKKFEYYDPRSPDDDLDQETNSFNETALYNSKYYPKKKRPAYNKSPDGVLSLDDYTMAKTYCGSSSSGSSKKRNSIITESGDSEFSATTAILSNSIITESGNSQLK